MRTSTPKRGRKAAKRLDLTDLRHILRDTRVWAAIGVATAPEDGSQHWRIETDDAGGQVDILVNVVTQPGGVPLQARLAAGVWVVPALGEEVAVLVPDGRFDFMPTIVALLSSNTVPDGTDPTTIVIARGKVLIHDGAGGAAPLPTLSEFNNHTHTSASSGSPTSTPISPATGTTVLEAK